MSVKTSRTYHASFSSFLDKFLFFPHFSPPDSFGHKGPTRAARCSLKPSAFSHCHCHQRSSLFSLYYVVPPLPYSFVPMLLLKLPFHVDRWPPLFVACALISVVASTLAMAAKPFSSLLA